MGIPPFDDFESFETVADGELTDAPEADVFPAPRPSGKSAEDVPTLPADELGPVPAPERTMLTTPVTDLPDRVEEVKAMPERKPIKGIPAVEFRARCDLIFEKFDRDADSVLNFEELA